MGVYQTTSALVPLQGDLPIQQYPLAASQQLNEGEPVYMNSGALTKWVAASGQGTTSTKFIGWVDQPTYTTVNGTKTALPTGTLVKVILNTKNVMWILPSYGTQVFVLSQIGDGSSYTVYNNAGIYSIDLDQTSNGVLSPFAPDYGDARVLSQGAPIYKTTWVVGDMVKTIVVDAAKQMVW